MFSRKSANLVVCKKELRPRRNGGKSMKQHKKAFIVWLVLIAALVAATIMIGPAASHEDVRVAMRDAVLHEENRVSLFGLMDVNPGLIAAIVINVTLLFIAALIRIFAIPKFTIVPGKFQLVLEQIVGLLDSQAGVKQPGKRTFVGAYIFAVGVYIFLGTLFELFGIQVPTTNGGTVTLPAPLSDVNAAICMGCLSYLVIVFGGAVGAGFHGVKAALKEFSLPISMSFRLFGALLSGLLVTDLVYHYAVTSYAIPVAVGVIFTMLHAVVQTYVLTMLVGIYYNEVSEKPEPKPKKEKKPKKLRPRKSAQAN
ncbi:MAG: F0F1 ATP synthase subunit A [Oscillospiraceae bacterium]|nr:F0F1 ATP synthase subunit A [Oscillospiraceae bacterium]